jgi:hypothetical protein
LGKSIALDLGAHQQKVVVNYVSEGSKAGAEATVEEIKALGGDAICVQADSTCILTTDDVIVTYRWFHSSFVPPKKMIRTHVYTLSFFLLYNYFKKHQILKQLPRCLMKLLKNLEPVMY